MTIRRYNLAIILPTFLTLGLIYCGIIYWLERTEIDRGLTQEATSGAWVVSSFLPEHWNEVLGGTDQGISRNGDGKARFLDRVAEWNPSDRFYVFSKEGGKLLYDSEAEAPWPAIRFPGGPAPDELKKGEVWLSPFERAGGQRHRLTAMVAVKTEGGQLLGYLGVEVNADRSALLNSALAKTYALVIGLFVGFGCCCSLGISWLLEKRLDLLSRTAARIEEGVFETENLGSRIKEVRELENAVRIMSSIFKEIVGKAKGFLFDGGGYLSDDAQGEILTEAFFSTEETGDGRVHAVCRPIGCGAPGCFWGTAAAAGKAWIFLGQLAGDAPPVRRTTDALALRRYLVRSLPLEPVKAVLDQACAWFRIARLVVLERNGEAGFVEHQIPEDPSAKGTWRVALASGLRVYTALDSRSGRIVEACCRQSSAERAEQLLEEIQPLVGSEARGAILMAE